jgi:hypothetical protein
MIHYFEGKVIDQPRNLRMCLQNYCFISCIRRTLSEKPDKIILDELREGNMETMLLIMIPGKGNLG